MFKIFLLFKKMDSKPILAIYTGYTYSFNPNDIHYDESKCSECEHITRCLAEHFINLFDVHIWSAGNFKQSVYNKITYHNNETYMEFQNKNTIEILIISRYINFFLSNFPIAKKIYFWLHEWTVQPYYNGILLPENGAYLFKNLSNNFNKIIISSEQHKSITTQWLNKSNNNIALTSQILEKFTIIPNLIKLSDFDIKIKRNNRSLIYIDDPRNNIDIVLELFQRCYRKEKKLSLYIITRQSSESQEELSIKIKDHKNITICKKSEMIEKLKYCTFLINPFINCKPFDDNVIQAITAGCIPIYLKIETLTNIITDDVGILIEKSDDIISDFYDNIFKLIYNKELKIKYRNKCLEFASKLDINIIGNIWIEEFKK